VIDQYVDDYFKGILSSTLGCEADVNLLRDLVPDAPSTLLGEALVRQSVTRSGQIGAASGLPTVIPGVGFIWLTSASMLDASLLLREQIALLIRLVYVYDPHGTRAQREMDAMELYARHASGEDLPTTALPALMGHFARVGFKNTARRWMHRLLRNMVSGWFSIPLSLLISARVNRDATANLGEFALEELSRGRS
jgi:hypothetical protein